MINLFKPYVHPDAIRAAMETLQSGWIGTGPKTEEFERDFADYCGSRYAIAVTSATDALNLAVKSLNLTPGAEVLTTSMTFVSTNHVLLYNNLVPVFVDVNPYTLSLNLCQVEAAITDKTEAIMIVHYAGNAVDMNGLYELAYKHNLKVVEDAAHACGAQFENQRIGGFGLTCFSFHAVKNLPVGDGGMITTNSETAYKRLKSLRWLGIESSTFERSKGRSYKWEYQIGEVGYKCAMNDVVASIGIEQLKHLDEWNTVRRGRWEQYREMLGSWVEFVHPLADCKSSHHLCVIKVPNRDEVVNRMALEGVELGVHYKPNHLYHMYAPYVRHTLPQTMKAYEQIVSLPMHLSLTLKDIVYVCDSLKECL